MQTFCGYVAIVGRPNVGKSTLLNNILGQKLSITSRKAQTTRHTILGVKTFDTVQVVYVDTPGFHNKETNALNRAMNKSVTATIRDVDVIVFVIDSYKWKEEDELVLKKIIQSKSPAIAVINKADRMKDKAQLLPLIQQLNDNYNFQHIIPVSAKSGDNVEQLENTLIPYLPAGPHLFDEGQLTDKPTRFMVSELIREKIFRLCGQELPYSVNVEIEQYLEEDGIIKISALILVDRANHKRMVIGNKGAKLKQIGIDARRDIEKLLGQKVFLSTWIKVKSGWADDERALRSLGYDT